MLLKGELHQPRDYITNVINPYKWLMVWQWRHFLVASTKEKCGHGSSVSNRFQQKIILYHVCQTTLNRKWSRKFEKFCKFSSCVQVKSRKKKLRKTTSACLMFVDLCIIVQFIKKNPTRCSTVSKFYYSIFIWSSACFGRHTAHHQEPKTALAASGFLYVEGCWTLSGTVYLTTSTNYTSNNLPHMKNHRLPVQF
jgi:hypothetical protein